MELSQFQNGVGFSTSKKRTIDTTTRNKHKTKHQQIRILQKPLQQTIKKNKKHGFEIKGFNDRGINKP